MPNETSQRNELVLAQNQYAYIQDATKGDVRVYVGPYKMGLTATDIPVAYRNGKFVQVDLIEAISQHVTAPEGSYVILENPAKDNKTPVAASNLPAELQLGRKVNVPGPTVFAPWPGQVATVLAGHQLKSNEYAVVRIYNAEEARENWKAVASSTKEKADDAVPGQLLIIKGTENNFFIPPNGFEVVKDLQAKFVRQALTLERLEYCILLDEDGNKRYEKGPAVVFPTATETFVAKKMDGGAESIKFKAVELNDQMGLYIKVIADYTEGDKDYVTGDELFITGKDQKIYYPRSEHALIEYESGGENFRRQRYYGIAIPTGEARYVLDKNTGVVSKQVGPAVFLPDPRNQVIVRRVLDDRTLDLWYPGNDEARAYNAALRPLMAMSTNYVQDTTYKAALNMRDRSFNRQTKGSSLLSTANVTSAATPGIPSGETVKRGTTFTQPPTLTLDTKYEGVPTINIWTGYAVQVVDRSGNRRVVRGPDTVLLAYDETLEMMTLSTGLPKSSNTSLATVYLRVDHNQVSDMVLVETKDMVMAEVQVSYKVNFEGDSKKWFAVEDYVKFLTEHMRSLLRAAAKHKTVKEFIDDSAEIVRDTVLGKKDGEKARAGRQFEENGMRVYDVDVLGVKIQDNNIANLLNNNQRATVTRALELASKEGELGVTKRLTEIEKEIEALTTAHQIERLKQQEEVKTKESNVIVAIALLELALETKRLEGQLAHEDIRSKIATEDLTRRVARDTHELEMSKQEADLFVKKFKAVDDKLISAIKTLADTSMLTDLTDAIAPLAIAEQQGIGPVLERLFKGTNILKSLNGTVLKAETETSSTK